MSKLYIPAPDEKKDPTELSHELWVAVMISAALIFGGWYFWILPQTQQPPDPLAYIEDVQEREEMRDRLRFAEVAEEEKWRPEMAEEEERARIYALAPRMMTEALCEEQKEALAKGEVPEDQAAALLESVERRSREAPWTCLVRQYLRGELPEEEPLAEAVAGFWQEVEEQWAHGALLEGAIDAFRESRDRPENERFYSWLRRCGMRGDYQSSPACRRLLRQLAPAQGSELLEMIQVHLSDEELAERDLIEVVQALGTFAVRGQPASWQVLETAKLPDYDPDFRLGAIYYLCRMVHSPAEAVVKEARQQLGRVAEVGGRPANPHMTYRWQRACRAAFGNTEDLNEPVPVLDVLIQVEEGEEPVLDYGMKALVAAGVCQEEEGYPLWFCGAERWTGGRESPQRVMATRFAESGYVEWGKKEQEVAEISAEETVE